MRKTHIAIDYDYWPAGRNDGLAQIEHIGAVDLSTLIFSTTQHLTQFGAMQLVVTQSGRLAGLGLPSKCSETPAAFLSFFQPLHFCQELTACQQLVDRFLAQEAVCLPLTLIGTAFQHRTWQALMALSFGETCSYQKLGQHVAPQTKMNAHAIGRAVGANPVSLIVPCHRVVSARGNLHGYRWGLDLKKRILAAEGVALL